MKFIPASERPDYNYWKTPREKRPTLSEEELAALHVELANYSNQKFALGRRFKLVKEYAGIPLGTNCTVVSVWPQVKVRWDKWATSGYGRRRPTSHLSFSLDSALGPTK